ncbi:MAG TPA: lmo0937 family membrane protein [Usitatibacter sp.]|nr:lmo0937 family membrane protein [Usitatibacter sp.]
MKPGARFTPESHGGVFMLRSPIASMKGHNMLYTLAVILIILWLLGMVGSYTLGGMIHVLLLIALVMIIVSVVSGRRAL